MSMALRGGLAVLATAALGVVVLVALGAPPRLWSLNIAAAVAGAGLVHGLSQWGGLLWRRPMAVLIAAAGALIATALWGADLEGVRRWFPIGSLRLHVGFLFLPVALAAMTTVGPRLGVAGAALIGAALAWQPDAGMAVAFALGVIGLALSRRSAPSWIAAAITVLAAVAALFRPDPLEPVRFVEGVVSLAVAQGPVMGAAAIVALAAPSGVLALIAWRRPDLTTVALPAALFWFGAAIASLLAHVPAPILGAGVSPILGYALTWGRISAPRTGTDP
ncbi:hypothetical protein [Phenylobacterium sp.]|jgi:hypothetical protein|uniref:hypothetical protein n=1 Tax=Phenylobacterium sp. TaxID=1871053 RepID=UPI0037C9DA76